MYRASCICRVFFFFRLDIVDYRVRPIYQGFTYWIIWKKLFFPDDSEGETEVNWLCRFWYFKFAQLSVSSKLILLVFFFARHHNTIRLFSNSTGAVNLFFLFYWIFPRISGCIITCKLYHLFFSHCLFDNIYIYIYINACVYGMCVYVSAYACFVRFIYIYIYIYACVYGMCVCMYVSVCVCFVRYIYIYICVCVYIYIYIRLEKKGNESNMFQR